MLRIALALLVALPVQARSRRKTRSPESCATTCDHRPLFDAPRAPKPVDAEVLELCPTPPESRVDPRDVQAFFAKHLDDQRLIQAVAKVAPFAKDRQARAQYLASIWSGPARRNAFTHVLCGDDWDTEKLGGLHLEDRYVQLEKEGKICFDGGRCDGKQCVIRYHGVAGFSCGRKQTGGFVQDMDALELLAAGTRAYAACCMSSTPRDGGRYAGPRGITFQIWCGNRNGQPGIATFYPVDGRPTCGD